MKRRHRYPLILLLLILNCAWGLADYEVHLVEDLFIIRAGGTEPCLARERGIDSHTYDPLVRDLLEYQVTDELVIGRSRERYFILSRTGGDAQFFKERADWEERLENNRIKINLIKFQIPSGAVPPSIEKAIGSRLTGPKATAPNASHYDNTILFIWSIVGFAAAALAVITFRMRSGHRPDTICAHCGYDLRATSARCPECGTIPSGYKSAAN